MTWAGKAPVTHKAASGGVAYVRVKTVVHMTSRTPYHRNEGFVGLCWCLKQFVEPFSYVNTCFCSKKCSLLQATWAKILYVTSLRTAQESLQKEEGEEIIFRLPIPDWGPVYTYPYSFENVTFFLPSQKNSRPLVAFSIRFRPSTRMRWINLKTITYPNCASLTHTCTLIMSPKKLRFQMKTDTCGQGLSWRHSESVVYRLTL